MKVKLTKVSSAFVLILLFISFSIYLGCDFDLFGGDPIDEDADDDPSFAFNIKRVSIATNGSQADDDSEDPSISSDGRFIAFTSYATNLVANDTNDRSDIFVHDRENGITARVSIRSNGNEADNDSFGAAISSDGRFVAFESNATNLVANDTNDRSDIFVHDRDTDEDGIFYEPGGISTERISVNSDGSQANGDSFFAAISSDGQLVSFTSKASDLVANDTNNKADIFVHHRENTTTELIIGPAEFNIENSIIIVAPIISPDGGFVGFRSNADNLVPGDANNSFDTFLVDLDTEIIERLSISSSGLEGNADSGDPSITSNNQFVVFSSNATNLVSQDNNGFEDVFVHNRSLINTRRVSLAFDGSEGNNSSFSPVISGDGQFVVFTSFSENLVDNDSNGSSDIFVIPNPLAP